MPDKQFWENNYRAGQTGWDMGMVSPPLKAYIDQLTNKKLHILIPGAGNSYEASYLLENGFEHVTVLDIAPTVVERLKEKNRAFEGRFQVIETDFFEHNGKYDLILEQTFFCAIDPEKRSAYARHIHELLNPGGKLSGVLFNRFFDFGPPPFGGEESEYKKLFEPLFNFKTWEPCRNSFTPRSGSEWFMILERK